jgi:hypothetical protein
MTVSSSSRSGARKDTNGSSKLCFVPIENEPILAANKRHCQLHSPFCSSLGNLFVLGILLQSRAKPDTQQDWHVIRQDPPPSARAANCTTLMPACLDSGRRCSVQCVARNAPSQVTASSAEVARNIL